MASPRPLGLADEASTERIIALDPIPAHPLKEQDAKNTKKPVTELAYVERDPHTTMVDSLQALLCLAVKDLRVSVMRMNSIRETACQQ